MSAAARVVLSAVWGGAILITATTILRAPLPPPPIPTIGHVAGMLAGYASVVMIVLMARVPWLEQNVGADRMTRWHVMGGHWTFALIAAHVFGATAAVQSLTGETVSATLVHVLGLPGIFAATLGTAAMLIAGISSAHAIRRRLHYETWHIIHLGMYAGIALAFAHELAGPDLAGRPIEQLVWAVAYAAAFGMMIRYRVIEPLFSSAYHRLRVESVEFENADVATITVTGQRLGELAAESGQFFRWRFLTRSTWHMANPFSLSAPPSGSRLRLTVKRAGAGTHRLFSIPAGTRVLAEGPYGAMTEQRQSGRGVLLIAGGVGITPMRALFESLERRDRPLTLIYRASSADQLLFRDELEQIAAVQGGELVYVVGSSKDPANRLDADRLRTLAPGLSRRDVYICASPGLSTALRANLRHAGVPARRIHDEGFGF